MTDQVLNKRKFLFRFRLKNQEDIMDMLRDMFDDEDKPGLLN